MSDSGADGSSAGATPSGDAPPVGPPQSGVGRWTPVFVAVAIVLVAALVGGVLVFRGSGSAGASVTLEPKTEAGPDPFTESVAIGPAPEFPGNVEAIATSTRRSLPQDPATGTREAEGTKPGLYGGTGDAKACDPEKLVSFLAGHPDKAKAWAGVLGITTSAIAGYVAGLSPVILTSDTVVGNHGFEDGRATSLTSVLQAGTAVMVDRTGTPRVKCNCGNPLTEPEPVPVDDAEGTAWPGWAPATTVVVNPGRPVTTITVLNVTTGDTYQQPVGSTGTTGTTDSTLDGFWAVTRTKAGIDECGPAPLNGATMMLVGGSASIRPDQGGFFSGRVTHKGDSVEIRTEIGGTAAGAESHFDLTGTFDGKALAGSSTYYGVMGPGGSGWTCDSPFTARRTFDPTGLPTSTTTAPAGTTRPADPSGAAGLPSGLACRDLVARGYSYDESVAYWEAQRRPALMDADSNGIPCETVFDASVVSAYWAAHGGGPGATTAPAGDSGPPCENSAVDGLSTGGDVVYSPMRCIGDWGLIEAHDSEVDLAPGLFHWTGNGDSARWQVITPDATGPLCTGTTVPEEFRPVACGVS